MLGGNLTLKLARQLIMGKKGLAITEHGESEDDADDLAILKRAFKTPVSIGQTKTLSALAKSAGGRGRRKVKLH